MATMTMRAFLTAVLATEGVSTEVAEFATAEIAKLDARKEARKTSKAALAKAESDSVLITAIVDRMTVGKAVTTAEMVAALTADGITASSAKVTALFKKMATEGMVTEGEGRSKGRKVKTFTLTEVGEDIVADVEGAED